MKKIIIFKSKCEKYESALSESNYIPVFIEPLRFEFVNETQLRIELRQPSFDALILTSPRAVHSVVRCWSESCTTLWRGKKVYVVGNATGELARSLLGLTPLGAECGNAAKLAELICAGNSGGNFLFPGGNLRSDTIARSLAERGLSVLCLCVYETKKSARLRECTEREDDACGAVYFSGSGCRYVNEECPRRTWAHFAVGESTAQALLELGIAPAGVAAEPTPQAVLHVIKEYFKLHSNTSS